MQLLHFCQMRSVHAIPSLLPDWMYTCNYFTKHKLTQMSIPVCMCFVIQLGVGTGLCSTLVFNSAPVQGATPGSKGHLAMEDIIHHQSDSGSESLDTPVKKHASPHLLTPSPVGQQGMKLELGCSSDTSGNLFTCGDKAKQGTKLEFGCNSDTSTKRDSSDKGCGGQGDEIRFSFTPSSAETAAVARAEQLVAKQEATEARAQAASSLALLQEAAAQEPPMAQAGGPEEAAQAEKLPLTDVEAPVGQTKPPVPKAACKAAAKWARKKQHLSSGNGLWNKGSNTPAAKAALRAPGVQRPKSKAKAKAKAKGKGKAKAKGKGKGKAAADKGKAAAAKCKAAKKATGKTSVEVSGSTVKGSGHTKCFGGILPPKTALKLEEFSAIVSSFEEVVAEGEDTRCAAKQQGQRAYYAFHKAAVKDLMKKEPGLTRTEYVKKANAAWRAKLQEEGLDTVRSTRKAAAKSKAAASKAAKLAKLAKGPAGEEREQPELHEGLPVPEGAPETDGPASSSDGAENVAKEE